MPKSKQATTTPTTATDVTFPLEADLYAVAAERAAAHGQTVDEYAAERFTAALRQHVARRMPTPVERSRLVEPRWKEKHKPGK